MRTEFENYPLSDLEAGLTVAHPTQAYPVWVPAIGVRMAFAHEQPAERLSHALSDAMRPLWGWFADEFRWRTGRKAGRWVKSDARDARAQIAEVPTGEWAQSFAGGMEMLQAHPLKCSLASWLHRANQPVGTLKLSVPIPWFIANEPAFLQWIDELCDRLPVQAGHVGLCGVGAREFPSKWNGCEFPILQRYLGIDPCDEAQMGPSTPAHDGYVHGPQWITLLGLRACERLGGIVALDSAATGAGLSVQARPSVLKIRASHEPQAGFDQPPAGFVALGELLRPGRGEQFFIGHAFELFKDAVFYSATEPASSLWVERFDDERSISPRWPGRHLAERSIEFGAPVFGEVPIYCDESSLA